MYIPYAMFTRFLRAVAATRQLLALDQRAEDTLCLRSPPSDPSEITLCPRARITRWHAASRPSLPFAPPRPPACVHRQRCVPWAAAGRTRPLPLLTPFCLSAPRRFARGQSLPQPPSIRLVQGVHSRMHVCRSEAPTEAHVVLLQTLPRGSSIPPHRVPPPPPPGCQRRPSSSSVVPPPAATAWPPCRPHLPHTCRPPPTMCLFLCLPTRRPRAFPPRRKRPPKPASPVPTWAFSPAHPRWTRDGAVEAQRGVNGGASATRLTVTQLCAVLESLLAGMMAELPADEAAARAADVLTRAVAVDLAHAVADAGQRLEAVQRHRADGGMGADTFTDAWAAVQRVSAVRDNLEVFHPLGSLRRQARLAAPATVAEGAPVAPLPSCSTNIVAFFHSPDASPDIRAFVTTVRDALGGLEASPTKMVLALSLLMAVTVDRALEVSAWNWRRLLFTAAAAAHLSVNGAVADLPALARRSGVMRGADDLHMCMRVLLEVLNESFVIDKHVLAGVEGDLVDGYAEQTGQRIESVGTSGAEAFERNATGGREAGAALSRAAD